MAHNRMTQPPKVTFATKIYHPNVDDDGSICVQLLKLEQWKPATKLSTGTRVQADSFRAIRCVFNVDTHHIQSPWVAHWSKRSTIIGHIIRSRVVVVFEALVNLLVSPNPDDPLQDSIANEYKTDTKAFEKTAKEWTAKYANS